MRIEGQGDVLIAWDRREKKRKARKYGLKYQATILMGPALRIRPGGTEGVRNRAESP